MKPTPELHALALVATATVLMWAPYIAARPLIHGPARALDNRDPTFPPLPAWAARARLAHANAVENLVVFAPLVLAANLIGVSTPATILASKVYLGARLVHYFVYAAGVPVVRTLAFMVGVGATLAIAVAVLGG